MSIYNAQFFTESMAYDNLPTDVGAVACADVRDAVGALIDMSKDPLRLSNVSVVRSYKEAN